MHLFALNCSSARLHMLVAIIKFLTSERFNTPLVTSKRAQTQRGFMPNINPPDSKISCPDS